MRVRIEVPDRQALHVREHRISQPLEHSLIDIDHQEIVEICRKNTNNIESCYSSDRIKQWSEVVASVLQHRRDIAVDKRLGKKCTLDIRQYTCYDENHHQNQVHRVVFENITEQPFHCGFCLLLFFLCPLHSAACIISSRCRHQSSSFSSKSPDPPACDSYTSL